jgi:hypothetical protein
LPAGTSTAEAMGNFELFGKGCRMTSATTVAESVAIETAKNNIDALIDTLLFFMMTPSRSLC